jgi:cytosine/adenosine deaminase-related metal-dependent hydrolase
MQATGANAKLLHLADRGTIAVGNSADLLVLDADPLVDIRGRSRWCITMGEVSRNYRGDGGNESTYLRIKNNGERF